MRAGEIFCHPRMWGKKPEMIALARESAHSRMPVQHWIFSWQEGEQPSREQVEEVVNIFLEKMGLDGHQTVYGRIMTQTIITCISRSIG